MDSARDVYLDYLARCHQVFRPFTPIDLPDFFKGRLGHIQMLRSELAKPGRHVAIFGERGVGKTSLATLAYFYANYSDEHTIIVRCEKASTFETIFGQVLQHAGITHLPNGRESNGGRSVGFALGGASIGKTIGHRSTFRATETARAINAAGLLSVFAARKGLIIIDEFDRVEDEATHVRLAELLKHFSDAASQTKIIVVGVAETLTGLIGEHESITRCLAQMRLDRMNKEELTEIIKTGEKRIGATFKKSIRDRIVGLSDGFPFYTHLIGGYCAEEAGEVLKEDPHANIVISEPEYTQSLRRAIESAENTLHEQYQAATVTVKRKIDMFKYVIWAIAYSDAKEVQVGEIASNIGLLIGEKPKTESLNNYLGPLVRPERGQILTRVRQGFYKYSNPLMRAYVRIELERHNIIEADGQLQFPWMRPV